MAPKLWQGGRSLEALEVERGLNMLLLLGEAACLRFLPGGLTHEVLVLHL
jgi:hypothetical protein